MREVSRDSRPSTIAIKTRDPSAYATARLIVIAPSGPEKSLVLGVPHVRIGAGSSNDVVIDDPHASRFHAELRKTRRGLGAARPRLAQRHARGRRRGQRGPACTRARPSRSARRASSFSPTTDAPRRSRSARTIASATSSGRSVRMREVFGVLERIAPTDLTVLIGGETGSGQGRRGARDPRGVAARQGAVRRLRLRGGGAQPHRVGAVRPREGRLHRRRRQPRGRVRARARRHAVSRRDRRAVARAAAEALARARAAARQGGRRAEGDRRSTCASSRRPTATSSRR